MNLKIYMDKTDDKFHIPQCLTPSKSNYLLLSEVVGNHTEIFNCGILVSMN